MPRRKLSEPTQNVLVRLYSRDYERLCALFPNRKATYAIRALVRAFLQRLDQQTDENVLDELEIELDG